MNQLSGDQEKRALRVFLYGAIGDAVGKAFEVAPWAEKAAIEVPNPLRFLPATYDGLGAAGKLPGYFTDDTQMTIQLARSMRRWNPNPPNEMHNPPEPLRSGYDVDRAAAFYLEWFREPDLDAPRGMGGTVRKALENLARGLNARECGIDPLTYNDDVGYCGNGSAMRASPLGLFYRDADLHDLYGYCQLDARITHRHPEAVAGSFAVALGVKYGLQLSHGDRDQWIVAISEALSKRRETRYTRVAASIRAVAGAVALSGRWGTARHDAQQAGSLVGSMCGESGDVAETVSSAFMCALLDIGDRKNLEKWTAEERLRSAILVGGDCDTRAAITGQMLAALGYELPAGLCEEVEASKYLVTLAKDVLAG